jgi:hypothetical protein
LGWVRVHTEERDRESECERDLTYIQSARDLIDLVVALSLDWQSVSEGRSDVIRDESERIHVTL